MKRYGLLLAIVLGLGFASTLPALLRGGAPCAPCAGLSSCPAPEVAPPAAPQETRVWLH